MSHSLVKNPPMFWLRWRFEYADHKPPVTGQYMRQGDIHTQAWNVNKTNLLYACIEAKNIRTKEIKTVVRVSGSDFLNFSWRAVQSWSRNAATIVGLEILTRNKIITASINGKVYVSDRPKDDFTHYEGFGK